MIQRYRIELSIRCTRALLWEFWNKRFFSLLALITHRRQRTALQDLTRSHRWPLQGQRLQRNHTKLNRRRTKSAAKRVLWGRWHVQSHQPDSQTTSDGLQSRQQIWSLVCRFVLCGRVGKPFSDIPRCHWDKRRRSRKRVGLLVCSRRCGIFRVASLKRLSTQRRSLLCWLVSDPKTTRILQEARLWCRTWLVQTSQTR